MTVQSMRAKYKQVARARAVGTPYAAIAKQLGVSVDTLRKWRRTADYQQISAEVQQEVEDLIIERMRGAAAVAVSTLVQIMQDPNASPGPRVRAAEYVWKESGLRAARQSQAVEDMTESDVVALIAQMPRHLILQALEQVA